MSTFSLILVTNRKPDSAMPGEGRWDLGSVMTIAPGKSLDLLIDTGSRVILVQPELRAPELTAPVECSEDISRMVGDYLSRARFFRNHEDAVIATGTLIRDLCRVMEGGQAPEPAPEMDRRLLRVIARIEEEGRWDFNLGELATYSGVSERNLYYLMKRETGLTPYRMYQRQRLLRVRRRLVDCQCDLPHISWYAADEGFSHLGRFAALYRQHFGELPSETVQWRRLPGTKPGEAAQTLSVY
ncbi:helix-turn-helix domain-containing protein [Marinobacter sp. HL-58]|uniref:helix-turn-helix domain-containing protein n=1 Tax=Marinobacter sp. HL-58 TaxID=1479237 RepID=UPI000A979478|nr:helix-turn-helix domain-containing protein [Marinobacter sp. HL-58]